MNEPCPNCGCVHIGTDILYSQGAALFCQDCNIRGPRVPVDITTEHWLRPAEIAAGQAWDEWAKSQKPTKAMVDDLCEQV